MKIKDGFVLREVAGEAMVIATGEASRNFNGIIRLNCTGRDIWEGLSDGLTEEEIAHKLVVKYGVNMEKALSDTRKLIARINTEGFLVS